jgi:hypothetical protein
MHFSSKPYQYCTALTQQITASSCCKTCCHYPAQANKPAPQATILPVNAAAA